MNNKLDTRTIVTQALIAAIYVAMTWAVPVFSYGAIQFRLAEVLTLLAFYNKKYIYGLTIACVIANILSPFGILDIIFGSLASLIALLLMSKIKNIWLASLMPALTSPIIAFVILITSKEKIAFFLVTGEIFISEFVIVTIIGVPLFKIMMKNKKIKEYVLD